VKQNERKNLPNPKILLDLCYVYKLKIHIYIDIIEGYLDIPTRNAGVRAQI
jgi:hypothetical protein